MSKNHIWRYILIVLTIIVLTLGIGYYLKKRAEITTEEKSFQPYPNSKQLIDEDIYKEITGFNIAETERKMVTDKGGSPVYGEIKYDSLQTIFNDLNIKSSDVFYDLGSGVGKVIIQAYLNFPFKKVVGIELSPTRHNNALKAREELVKRNLINPNRKIEFIQGDIAELNLCDATVIYMCSTCYPVELMKKIAEKCSNLKKGMHVISLKSLPDYQDYGFILEKEYSLPMTWSEGSPVYVYKLDPEEAKKIKREDTKK